MEVENGVVHAVVVVRGKRWMDRWDCSVEGTLRERRVEDDMLKVKGST